MKVKNRSTSVAGYTIPDANIRRRFAPGETKEIPQKELEMLLYQPGGAELFYSDLQVSAEDLKLLNAMPQEQEYFYSEDQVKAIMLQGSLDEFLDMLDFAPAGILEMVKKYATSLPMTDMNKCDALKNKTGFDAMKALTNLRAVENDSAESTGEDTGVRRRRVATTEETTTSKYKILN